MAIVQTDAYAWEDARTSKSQIVQNWYLSVFCWFNGKGKRIWPGASSAAKPEIGILRFQFARLRPGSRVGDKSSKLPPGSSASWSALTSACIERWVNWRRFKTQELACTVTPADLWRCPVIALFSPTNFSKAKQNSYLQRRHPTRKGWCISMT